MAQSKPSTTQTGPQESVCGPIRHPMRARILEITAEREISPIQFVNEGLQPEGFAFSSHQAAVSFVSYHFRERAKAGCIRVVDRRQRRGATEHIYRGGESLYFTDEEFEEMPLQDRQTLTRVSLQTVFARADSAIRSGTFDARTDRHLTWTPLTLDEQGWGELTDGMEALFYRVQAIQEAARERIASSDCEVMAATCAMLGFPSPPPPPLPKNSERPADPR